MAQREEEFRRALARASTPLLLLEQAAQERPDHPALLCYVDPGMDEVRTVIYRELLAEVRKAVCAFRRAGLGREDSVAILAPPTPESVAAFLAASVVGAAFPMNLLFSADAIRAQLRLARARIVIVARHDAFDLAERVKRAVEADPQPPLVVELPLDGRTSRPSSWQEFLSQGGGGDVVVAEDPRRVGALLHTGGTTGEPKLAQLSLENLAAGALMTVGAVNWLPEDRIVSGLPLFHVAGSVDAMLAPIAAGSTLIYPSVLGARDPRFIQGLWSFVERSRATILGLVPTSLAAAQEVPRGHADLSRLRAVVTGGSSLPPVLAKRFEKLCGVPVCQVYGLTEASGIVAAQPMDGRTREPAVGFPAPGVEVRLDGEQATRGEVIVKGPHLFQGYRTANGTVDRPGEWLRTGDLGEIGEDGQLRLVGRSKDIIIRSGHNIDPLLIEDVAQTCPDVLQAGAVGMPDAYAGELPVLFVELVAGSSADGDSIASVVGARIAEPPARPRQVFVVDQIPLTPAGKVARFKLRQRAAEMRAREILDGQPIEHLVCTDPAAREIRVSWQAEASDEARAFCQARLAELGLALVS